MRTTLTLDDDNAAQLERLRRDEGRSFKELVNRALREGLKVLAAPQKAPKAYQLPTLDLGRCRVGSLDNVAEVLEQVEGNRFPESGR